MLVASGDAFNLLPKAWTFDYIGIDVDVCLSSQCWMGPFFMLLVSLG
jgi:hypothetical protein